MARIVRVLSSPPPSGEPLPRRVRLRRMWPRLGAWAALLVLAAPSTGHAVGYGRLPDRFQDEAVVTQLNHPVGMAFLPDGRLLVAEQRTAKLRMVVNGRVAASDPLLTVDS